MGQLVFIRIVQSLAMSIQRSISTSFRCGLTLAFTPGPFSTWHSQLVIFHHACSGVHLHINPLKINIKLLTPGLETVSVNEASRSKRVWTHACYQ